MKTFTQQAEEIKKGCGTYFHTWNSERLYCGRFSNQDKLFHYCPECLAKAKALQEAGNGFLEFLVPMRIDNAVSLNKDYMFKIIDKIADIQNGLKILGEIIK